MSFITNRQLFFFIEMSVS